MLLRTSILLAALLAVTALPRSFGLAPLLPTLGLRPFGVNLGGMATHPSKAGGEERQNAPSLSYCIGVSVSPWFPASPPIPSSRDARSTTEEREFFIDNLLVRIHLIIEMILVDRPCAMGV